MYGNEVEQEFLKVVGHVGASFIVFSVVFLCHNGGVGLFALQN